MKRLHWFDLTIGMRAPTSSILDGDHRDENYYFNQRSYFMPELPDAHGRSRRCGGCALGQGTQPIEAGYLANAYLYVTHPDFDACKEMMDDIGRTIVMRAG